MNKNILVSIVMGSQSDWKVLSSTERILKDFGVTHEKKIVSAHRTPDRLYDFAKKIKQRKVEVVIAGAGGAAHLPGMISALTSVPVIGVPIETKTLKGLDSLLSIVQMPAGIPVGTLAIGKPGAINAALLAASVLSLLDETISNKLDAWRQERTDMVALEPSDEK